MQTERRDSWVEVEQTELDQALEEINEKWEAAGRDILSLNNKKKTEEDIATEEGVQKKACKKGGNPFVFFVFYMCGNSNKIIGVNYNLRPTIKIGWLIYIIIILSLHKCYF